MTWHTWISIAAGGVAVISLLGWMIARSQSGLDRKERAVVRGAVKTVWMVLPDWLYLLSRAVDCFLYYNQRAAVKKVVGFNPRKQNRAEGVIFWFYELRITRAELIKGYEMNAQRIPLRGLTATVTETDTVDVTIKGPDTKFVYSMPDDVLGGFNPTRARQFAALLNYEAGRVASKNRGPGEPQPPPTPAPAQHQDGCMCGRCCQQRVAARRLAR
jgi:hypothetical protein